MQAVMMLLRLRGIASAPPAPLGRQYLPDLLVFAAVLSLTISITLAVMIAWHAYLVCRKSGLRIAL